MDTRSNLLARLMILVPLALGAACADSVPVAPNRQAVVSAQLVALAPAEENDALATLRRATARYHDLNAAIGDGFVFLHGCEVRPEEDTTHEWQSLDDRP